MLVSWPCAGLLAVPEPLGELVLVGCALPSAGRQLQQCWWQWELGMNLSVRDWIFAGINQPCLVQHDCVIDIRSRSGSDLPTLLVKLPSLRIVSVHL